MSNLLTSLTAAALSCSLIACVARDDRHEVSKAIPTAEQVRIGLPTDDRSGVIGETSPWYTATRNVTLTFNGGTAWVLVVVHAIVQFPATSTDGDTATWGPWDDGPLAPATYRLDVTALADGTYDWALAGKSKSNPAAEFEVIIDGHAEPDAVLGQGQGTFAIDFDAAERVNPVDNDGRGTIAVDYDLAARTLAMSISTIEDRDGVPTPVDAEYAYAETEDGGGNMTFSIHGDAEDDEGELAEDAVLRSRWLPTGAGRADLRISGGDLGDLEVTGSDCWSTTFARTYYADSVEWAPTEGDPSTCVFADQDLPE
jgi:hypothetical protein